jgi:hypothetical protein
MQCLSVCHINFFSDLLGFSRPLYNQSRPVCGDVEPSIGNERNAGASEVRLPENVVR